MTNKTAAMVAAEIKQYINSTGVLLGRQWYVGITSDVDERLFGAHNVSKAAGVWIWRETMSEADARAIEAHFLHLGCSGGTGGGGSDCVYVYAYVIQSYTRE